MFDIQKFEKMKTNAEQLYQKIDTVYCPYFKEKVHFNSLGLEHLKFKRRGKTRLLQDQYMRMKLLHLAPDVISKSGTLQGIWNTKSFEKIRINNRTEEMLCDVIYYEFVAVIGMYRLRVIIKQIGQGNRFFWSLIPYWRTSRNKGGRKLHDGNPAED